MTDKEYSGKFLVRVPKSLHKLLAETAGKEGVSLNQYVIVCLSMGLAILEEQSGGNNVRNRR